jgi:hypothetical protein
MVTHTEPQQEDTSPAQTLWSEQDVRKIPVEKLTGNGNAYWGIVFTPGSKDTHRKEFAAFRKALKEFKPFLPEAYQSWRHSTVGEEWQLHPDLFSRFADWMEFPDDLDILKKRAAQEHDEEAREWKHKMDEEIARKEKEQREKRVPCTAPCKIRVLSLQCIATGEYMGLGGGLLSKGELGKYTLQLADGANRQEQESLELFCAALRKAQEDKTEWGMQGSWRNWTLKEYTLLHYSDWLKFPDPDDGIENILARTRAEYETKEDERWRQWEEAQRSGEAYSGAWDQFFRRPFASHGKKDIQEALSVFGIDADFIKRQYRMLAKQHHPDVGGDTTRFKRIHDAYQVLLEWVGNSD